MFFTNLFPVNHVSDKYPKNMSLAQATELQLTFKFHRSKSLFVYEC